jgi:hypothetical protein
MYGLRPISRKQSLTGEANTQMSFNGKRRRPDGGYSTPAMLTRTALWSVIITTLCVCTACQLARSATPYHEKGPNVTVRNDTDINIMVYEPYMARSILSLSPGSSELRGWLPPRSPGEAMKVWPVDGSGTTIFCKFYTLEQLQELDNVIVISKNVEGCG